MEKLQSLQTKLKSMLILHPNGAGGNSGIKVTGSNNAEKIYNYLVGQGLSSHVAAGIMGNMMQENGMRTEDNSGGLGLVQWIGSRRTAAFNYARKHGMNPTSLEAQLGFLMHELNTGSGGLSRKKLSSARNAAEAALWFSNYFERPNARYANNGKRQSYANQYYNLYGR